MEVNVDPLVGQARTRENQQVMVNVEE